MPNFFLLAVMKNILVILYNKVIFVNPLDHELIMLTNEEFFAAFTTVKTKNVDNLFRFVS